MKVTKAQRQDGQPQSGPRQQADPWSQPQQQQAWGGQQATTPAHNDEPPF